MTCRKKEETKVVLLVALLPLSAAGCQFRPNPLYSPATPDLAPATAPASPDDLASPPTTDLGAADAAPASDLLSPCIRVTEPFAADASARWTVMGDASLDAPPGGLQLTSLGYNVAGSAFYDSALPSAAFDATFKFRAADGSGADGLAFVVAKAASPSALTPFGDGVVNAGYGLGYLGMDGFAVEIDTFMDLGNGDPNGNHVSLVRTSDGTHVLNGTPANLLLRSTSARTAHVRFTGTHLTVDIDGARTIDADLPSGFARPTGSVFYGFTSASSALNDRHAVSDLSLTVGAAGVCF
jgi:hypothetical protein